MTFAELQVGDHFHFPAKGKKLYTKHEEIRRPYTPEAYSNASFDWQNVVPATGEVLSEGTTFFYVTPSSEVLV